MSTLRERVRWAVLSMHGEFTVFDVSAKYRERYANVPANPRLAAIMSKNHMVRSVGERIVPIGYSTSNMAVYVSAVSE